MRTSIKIKPIKMVRNTFFCFKKKSFTTSYSIYLISNSSATKANITRDQMAKKTAEVKQKIAEIESLITEKQETLDMQKDLFLDAKQEQLTKLSKLDEFDEEVIRYLIDYVLVYDNEHIEIRWNFDDFQAG